MHTHTRTHAYTRTRTHSNDYFANTISNRTDLVCSPDSAMVDLWEDDDPAARRHGNGHGGLRYEYEEEMFAAEATRIIRNHSASGTAAPLLLYYGSHVPHTPMQVPQRYLDRFLNVTEVSLTGQGYAAMVAVLDDAVRNITGALKDTGLWDNTLLIFQSDNGGPVYNANFKRTGTCPSPERPGMTGPGGRPPYSTTCLDFGGAANNHPLRGGKETAFEGGIRVVAFAGGGVVPPSQRGTRRDGFIHTADWLATLAALAKVDPTDHTAAAHGLPPIDSLNCLGMLMGNATSPRQEFALGGLPGPRGFVSGRHKLIVGTFAFNAHTGPHFPNASSADVQVRATRRALLVYGAIGNNSTLCA